ncbi:MAG: class I SAM-dependent methyltransferase [Pseudomonadota bacterium]
MKMDPQRYYDAFSEGYDSRRHDGYHALLDELESALVQAYCTDRHVLDAGCGTGLILQRVQRELRSLVGADLSGGMLRKAATRSTASLVQASLTQLPFADASFDAAYSFKVLAHIPDIRGAVAELGRVVKPGGHLLLEFYNPLSIRGLLWHLKRPGRIARGVRERDVFVRFDTPHRAQSYLPDNFSVVETRGIRVVTPFAQLLRMPGLGPLVADAERLLATSPARVLGSFFVVVAQRRDGGECCDDAPAAPRSH